MVLQQYLATGFQSLRHPFFIAGARFPPKIAGTSSAPRATVELAAVLKPLRPYESTYRTSMRTILYAWSS